VVVWLAPVKPVALADRETSALPSVSELFGAVSANVAETLPAGMLTVVGTVSRDVVSDASVTVSVELSVPDIETVPVPLVPSVIVAGRARVRFVFSLSSTAMGAVPSVQLAMCAVIVAFCVPSILLSSITVIVNVADVCPVGIVTVVGTTTVVTSLEVNVTEIGTVADVLMVTVPCTDPAPSIVEAGTESVRIAVSLSLIAITPVPAP